MQGNHCYRVEPLLAVPAGSYISIVACSRCYCSSVQDCTNIGKLVVLFVVEHSCKAWFSVWLSTQLFI